MAGLAPPTAAEQVGNAGPFTIAFTSFPAEAVRQLEQLCVVSAHELLLDEVSWHRRPDLICAKFFLIGSLGVYPQVEYILPIPAVAFDWQQRCSFERVKTDADAIRDFTRTTVREEGFWNEINAGNR